MRKAILLFAVMVSSYLNFYSQQSGTFIDSRDSFPYNWVEIGNQVWMAENLNYNDAASGFYESRPKDYNRGGRLYSWEKAQNICPDSWHLPSVKEWHALMNSYGEIFDENGNIPYKELTKSEKEEISKRYKETFLKFQLNGESGFDVIYAGYIHNHQYSSQGTIAGFWTSDENKEKGFMKDIFASCFQFKKYGKDFVVHSLRKSNKYSVRCVKNDE